MTHERRDATDATREQGQVSRRNFLGRGVAGLGAVALAGSALGQVRTPVQPRPGGADPRGRFAGKVVLITGATYGIGEATAEEMARAVMFLAGDEATAVVGTDLDVTGGYLTK